MNENLNNDAFRKLLDRINDEAKELVEVTGCLEGALLESDMEEISYSLREMRRLVSVMENHTSMAEKLFPASGHE